METKQCFFSFVERGDKYTVFGHLPTQTVEQSEDSDKKDFKKTLRQLPSPFFASCLATTKNVQYISSTL
jgi:hypothetical protein